MSHDFGVASPSCGALFDWQRHEPRRIEASPVLAPWLGRTAHLGITWTAGDGNIMKIARIVSGGQTGADRAALDWAIEHEVPHGGWCPAGRRAEDGTIPARYQLEELPEGGGYRRRTKANVRDSDATLIVSIEPVLTGGSKETRLFAQRLAKPWLHLHPGMDWRAALRDWLSATAIHTLNVAGPRGSREPEVAAFTRTVLDELQRLLGSSS